MYGVDMTKYKEVDASTIIMSPITGKDIEVSIRAYCPKCGCLVSHGEAKTVSKAVDAFVKCKRCDCASLTIKFTAVEMINGEIIKLHK